MKHTYYKTMFILLITLFLTGCLYPKGELAENKIPYEDQLELVQAAMEAYQESTNGLLPIKTKPAETPIFEKHLIDFDMMKERNLISSIPGNSFEKGGIYQYSIITPEEDPQVKLIDLQITEELRKIHIRIDAYRNKNLYPPFGEMIQHGVYLINYEKLGLDRQPHIVSPYSQTNLPIVMDVNGDVFVDYRIDLNNALKEYEHEYKEGDDIRYLLTDHYPFAPAYSLPYTIEDGEPVFDIE